MSDARWVEIDADIAAAMNHFAHAVRIYRQGGLHANTGDGRFRHVAAHAYDTFDPDDADPAVRAAERVAAGLSTAMAAYRSTIDP